MYILTHRNIIEFTLKLRGVVFNHGLFSWAYLIEPRTNELTDVGFGVIFPADKKMALIPIFYYCMCFQEA
jgi:hypothetical protein